MTARRSHSRVRASAPSKAPALSPSTYPAPARLPEHIERAMAEADPWREEDEREALSRRYGHLDLDRGVFDAMRTTRRPSLTDLTKEVHDLALQVRGGTNERGGYTEGVGPQLANVQDYLMQLPSYGLPAYDHNAPLRDWRYFKRGSEHS